MINTYNLDSQIEFLSFGLMIEINHFLLGTYVTAQIEDIMNLNLLNLKCNEKYLH